MAEKDEELIALEYDSRHGCFGCGDENRSGLKMRFMTNARHEAVCRFRMPRRFQGPHGFAHGGLIATVLDEAMSKAIHASPQTEGLMAMTRHFEVDYLRPVPLAARLEARAVETRVEGRKHFCEGRLLDEGGHVLARAKALFIAIPRDNTHKH